jgi:hypothetical protein
MPKSISDEISNAGVLQPAEKWDSVVEDGRRSLYHLVGLYPGAVADLDARDLRRDDFVAGSGLVEGAFERLEKPCVRTV